MEKKIVEANPYTPSPQSQQHNSNEKIILKFPLKSKKLKKNLKFKISCLWKLIF